MKQLIAGLILGLVVGVLGAVMAPRILGPRLPAAWTGGGETTEGTVVAKLRETDRLLLKVDTPQGAVLATFKEMLNEIDLLVQEGDKVSLAVSRYQPFIENPVIERVRKKSFEPPAAEMPTPAAAGEGVEPPAAQPEAAEPPPPPAAEPPAPPAAAEAPPPPGG